MKHVDELFVGNLARVRVVNDVEHVVEFAARCRKFYRHNTTLRLI